MALKHPFTASSVAQAFLSNIYKLHGLPQAIVLDRDRIFTSMFWRELFKLACVELCLSIAYHPQLDEQTERVNHAWKPTCVAFFMHVPSNGNQWRQWLDQDEFWYNTSWHSALNRSPFAVLYGYSPRQFGVAVGDDKPITDLSSWLTDRELMFEVIRLHLNRAKQRMKRQADDKRSESMSRYSHMCRPPWHSAAIKS